MGEYEAEALAAGADEVYSKSTFIDDFETILKKYLQIG
jgi:hypothetical protein